MRIDVLLLFSCSLLTFPLRNTIPKVIIGEVVLQKADKGNASLSAV